MHNGMALVMRRVLAFAIACMLCTAGALAIATPYAEAAPAKAKITSVKSSAAGQVVVTVKKAKGAKGYQVVASTTKKFDKAARYDLESSSVKKTTIKLNGLKEGKTYYVKARAYAKKGDYGKWSAVKTVKVKTAANPLSADLEKAKKDNAAYAKQVESLESDLKAAKADLAIATGDKEALEARIAELTTELQAAQAQAGEAAENLRQAQEANTALASQVESLTDERDAAQQALNTANEDKEALTQQVETLSANLETAQTRASEAETALAEAQEANEALSERVDALEASLQTTQQGLANANGEIAELQSQVETLSGELSTTQDQVESLTGDLATEQGKTTELNQQVEGLAADVEALQAEVERLASMVDGSGEATITYELDGGVLPEGAKTTVTKDDGEYKLPVPTKQGYVFDGWYSDAGFTDKWTIVYCADGELTLYAKWSEAIYYAYVDEGRTISVTVWDDASESYVPADKQVYELYIGTGEDAPAVGDSFQGGTVAYLGDENPDYVVGSITLLNEIDADKLVLPSKEFCTKLDYSKVDFSQVELREEAMWSLLTGWGSSLQELDISGWDFSAVSTDVLSECLSYQGSDWEQNGWDGITLIANNITLPKNCYGLLHQVVFKTIIGLDTWDTSGVTRMGSMFEGCRFIDSLDLSSWDTSSVTDMDRMFLDANIDGSLNISGWNTGNVKNMSSMFASCSVHSLDLSAWNTIKVTNMQGMFDNCRGLEELDLSSFRLKNVVNLGSFFSCNYDLVKITTGDGWEYNSAVSAEESRIPWFTENEESDPDHFKWQDEDGNLYSFWTPIPQGAHVYTRVQVPYGN